jgi:hypothetical protein
MVPTLFILGTIEIVLGCLMPFAFALASPGTAWIIFSSGVISGILLIAFGKLIHEAEQIRKNTRSTADYFDWLRKRQEDQTKRPQAGPAGAAAR